MLADDACFCFASSLHAVFHWCLPFSLQVTKYVEREIINYRCLVHPHIVQFKEVSCGWAQQLSVKTQYTLQHHAASMLYKLLCSCSVLYLLLHLCGAAMASANGIGLLIASSITVWRSLMCLLDCYAALVPYSSIFLSVKG